MLFINKKEEVLDIELTPYGKYLLSKGKLKPVYYCFFDDNILYDKEYSGISENQSEAKNRIRKDTPQLKTQYKFDSEGKKGPEIDFGTGDKIVPEAPLVNYALTSPLSNSEIGSNKVPAVTLAMLHGKIDSYDLDYRTKFGNKNINQINTRITYEVSEEKLANTSLEGGLAMDFDLETPTGDELLDNIIQTDPDADGKYLKIKTEYLLVDIFEENVPFEIDNFEIEVFRIKEGPRKGNEIDLIPLKFSEPQKKASIVNNILVEEKEIDLSVELTPEHVEYYFHVFCDSDIDREVIENSVTELKSKGFFTDTAYDFKNAPRAVKEIADIYGDNVTNLDVKDC